MTYRELILAYHERFANTSFGSYSAADENFMHYIQNLCRYCLHAREEHVLDKCLFMETSYEPRGRGLDVPNSADDEVT